MLRVWAAHGKQDVILMGLNHQDPKVWGVFLADLIRHIARSYQLNFDAPLDETMRSIRAAYEAEMASVSDWGEGTLFPEQKN